MSNATATATTTWTPDPSCFFCQGTGVEPVFESPCLRCSGEEARIARTWGGYDPSAAPAPAPRPQGQGGATSGSSTPALPSVDEVEALANWLAGQRWSTFAQDLAATWERTGRLSPRQYAAGASMRAKVEAKATERKAAEGDRAPLPEVPAGRYAVESEEGPLRFYRVDRPTEGRWEGYTFVKVLHGPDETPIRGKAAAAILAKIARDPKAAMIRYGLEIGSCGACGRRLTDEESRAAGIGPICAAKW
jgi:hypothetical protein